MAVDPLATLKAGLEAGESRAFRLYFDALGMGTKEFNPARLVAYAEKKALSRFPGESTRSFVERLNPRDWDYVRKVRLAAKYGWKRFGMTETEAVELVNEALARRWRVKHGLEYRFLVAFLRAPDAVPDALIELDAADFVNACYAVLFASLREHGIPSADAAGRLLESHGELPPLGREWWATEARETFAKMLARRTRWSAPKPPSSPPQASESLHRLATQGFCDALNKAALKNPSP